MRRSPCLLVTLGAMALASSTAATAQTRSLASSGKPDRAPSVERHGDITTFENGAAWEAENHVTQGSRVGDTIYVAGQFSHDAHGRFVGEGDPAKQTRQTFANLDQVLAGLGTSKRGIVELEVFLLDPARNFKSFKDEYRRWVGDAKLTVTLVGVTALAYPQELVEIRAVAHAAAGAHARPFAPEAVDGREPKLN